MQEGQEFAIVFRTFGTDLPRVLRAVNRALIEGAHPLFPDLPDLKVKPHLLQSQDAQLAQTTKVYFTCNVNNFGLITREMSCQVLHTLIL